MIKFLTKHFGLNLSFNEVIQAIAQQDGAVPHFANPVEQILNINLQGLWIGRGSIFFLLANTLSRFNCM